MNDLDLFHKLYEDHYKGILNFFRYRLGNQDIAEDAAQETFTKLYQALPKMEGKSYGKAKNSLYQIANNYAIDLYRRASLIKWNSLEAIWPHMEQDSRALFDDPQQTVVNEDLMREALSKLNQKQRDLLILNELGGYSQKELSELLEMKENTVKVTLKRTRKALREIYTELLERAMK
jgi:RNA polymerase sigma-70 factor, ECF subfamily